jgi:hypothetical protein
MDDSIEFCVWLEQTAGFEPSDGHFFDLYIMKVTFASCQAFIVVLCADDLPFTWMND